MCAGIEEGEQLGCAGQDSLPGLPPRTLVIENDKGYQTKQVAIRS